MQFASAPLIAITADAQPPRLGLRSGHVSSVEPVRIRLCVDDDLDAGPAALSVDGMRVGIRRTGGRHDAHADISAPTVCGHLGDGAEYARLERAMRLDRQAAFDSASWGLGQIMGYHAPHLGYPSTEAMVARFREGEDEQLAAAQRFISAHPPLRQAFAQKKWSRVAFFYNGAAYARHGYDRRLEHFHDLYELKGTPSITVRMAQAWLTYLGYRPRGIDGILGPGTEMAVIDFQKARGLPVTAEPDEATLEQLRLAVANGAQAG